MTSSVSNPTSPKGDDREQFQVGVLSPKDRTRASRSNRQSSPESSPKEESTESNTNTVANRTIVSNDSERTCKGKTAAVFSGRYAERFHDASTEAQKKLYEKVCDFFDAGFKKTNAAYTKIVDGPQLTITCGKRTIKLETEISRKIGQLFAKIGVILNLPASFLGRGVITGLLSVILNAIAVVIAFVIRAAFFALEKGLGLIAIGATLVAICALPALVAAGIGLGIAGFVVAVGLTIVTYPIVFEYNRRRPKEADHVRLPISIYCDLLLGKPGAKAVPALTGLQHAGHQLTSAGRQLGSSVVATSKVQPEEEEPRTPDSPDSPSSSAPPHASAAASMSRSEMSQPGDERVSPTTAYSTIHRRRNNLPERQTNNSMSYTESARVLQSSDSEQRGRRNNPPESSSVSTSSERQTNSSVSYTESARVLQSSDSEVSQPGKLDPNKRD